MFLSSGGRGGGLKLGVNLTEVLTSVAIFFWRLMMFWCKTTLSWQLYSIVPYLPAYLKVYYMNGMFVFSC